MKTLGRVEDAEEIRGRFGRLTAGDERVWGEMSVGEMVCHVREAYVLGAGGKAADEVKIPLPRPVMKWLALRAPMKWPRSVPTVPELKRERLTVPGEFGEDVAGALAAMDRFVGFAENRTQHPIFGTMEPGNWMRWGYLHADHHLRQFGR